MKVYKQSTLEQTRMRANREFCGHQGRASRKSESGRKGWEMRARYTVGCVGLSCVTITNLALLLRAKAMVSSVVM